MAQISLAGHSVTKSKKKSNFKRYIPYFIMLLPGAIYLIINNYMPMIGLVIAFKNINFSIGIFKSPWVGLDNFKFLFSTSDAWLVTRNTLLYNGIFLITSNVIPIALAIFLSIIANKKLLKLYQSVILLPYLISYVVVSYLVYAFLNSDMGFLNKVVLPAFGGQPVNWYNESKYWFFLLPLMNIWKTAGYQCIIYLASIVGIDKEYYEAAELDGVNSWQQITKITLPLIRPTIIILVLLGIGRIFYSDFGLFYQVPMDAGVLYPATNVIDTYVYRALLQLGDFGMSSAAGFYQSIVGFILILTTNFIVRKISPDEAMF